MSIQNLLKGKINPAFLKAYNEQILAEDNSELKSILKKIDTLLSNQINSIHINKSHKIDHKIINELFNLGIFSLFIPQKYNGAESTTVDFIKIITEISKYDLSLTVTIVPHLSMGLKSLVYFSNDEQKNLFFTDFIKEKRFICFALTEGQAGSDVANHNTTLTKYDDNHFVLNGIKNLITNALSAYLIVVVARCPDLTKIPGGSTFLYIKPEDEGLTITTPYDKMGVNGSVTAELIFNNIKISKERLIGKPGIAMEQFNQIVNTGRLGVAAGATGTVKRILNLIKKKSIDITEEVPIIPWIEKKLFSMEAMLHYAAFCLDIKTPDHPISTILARLFCVKESLDILDEIFNWMQIEEYLNGDNETFQILKDLPILRIVEGPDEILGYRAGLGLLTSLIREYDGETDITQFIAPELHHLSPTFNLLLKEFKDIINNIGEKYENFINLQFVIDWINKMTSSITVILAGLLYSSLYLKNLKPYYNKKFIIETLDYLTKKAQIILRTAKIEEESGLNEQMTDLFSCQKISSRFDIEL